MTEVAAKRLKIKHVRLIKESVAQWNKHRPTERQQDNAVAMDQYVDLTNEDFSGLDLSEIDFENTDLSGTKFNNTNLTNSNLSRIKTNNYKCTYTSFKGAVLDNSDLTYTNLVKVNCESATFINADLSDSSFFKVNLTRADLTDVIVNTRTSFDSINECENCKIDKNTLNNLEKKDDKIGGLHSSALSKMIIIDDFGKLKLSFSGFWRSVHAASLFIFVFPYAFFLFKLWSISYGLTLFEKLPASTDTIGQVFWEYIYTAGALDDKFSFLSLIALTLVLYNFCRMLLLWKTITEEHRESVYNLPISFKLDKFWTIIYLIVSLGVWVNLALILINTYNFLSQPLTG